MRQSIRRSVSMPVNGAKLSFEIVMKKLFANNEQGFFYDPNDLSTMYQDSTGTVPVTGVGQPVGLILDKKNPALVGGEVDIDINGWVVPQGVNIVGKNSFSSLTAATGSFYDGAAIDGLKAVELHYTVTGGTVQICDAVGTRVRAESTQPSGVLKATFYPDRSSSPLGRIYLRLPTAGTTVVINKLIVHTYTGNHAYQTTSASRPILRKNATTGANYLEFDGTDDFLQTGNIDFSGTDKVSLVAGVRKLSDVTASVVFELSPSWLSNEGSFIMHAPYTNGGSNFYSGARGNATATLTLASRLEGSKYAAPVSAVVSAKHDISGDYSMMLVNGARGSAATTDKGTGNFGNYPLYIGRRAGIVAAFTGHIYGLIGIGKLTTDTETAVIEKELAKRVGVSLNV